MGNAEMGSKSPTKYLPCTDFIDYEDDDCVSDDRNYYSGLFGDEED